MISGDEGSGIEGSPIDEDWTGEHRLIIFFIPAPIPLALPQDSTFSFERAEEVPWLKGTLRQPVPWVEPIQVPHDAPGGFVSFKVWRLAETLTLDATQILRASRAYSWMMDADGEDPGPLSPDFLEESGVESEATVFEAVTPLIPEETNGEIDHSKSVSSAFDRCLESLEELYRAYIVSESDWRVQSLTRRTVASSIPWATVDPSDKNSLSEAIRGKGLFLVNQGETNPLIPVGTMEPERIQRMLVYIRRRKQAGEHGDPMATGIEHKRRAERAYHLEADYQACLFWSYCKTETLLDGLLLMSAWEEAVPAEEAAGWFEHGLVGRISRRYSSRFGGNWDITLADTPLGKWRTSVEEVRHRVVHHGYRPSEFEARDALDAGEGLQKFLLERLTRSRRRFPKTAMIWLGIPGLKRRHSYDRRIRELAEGEYGGEPWLVQYKAYVEDVRSRWRFR